jgi:hypothetical protein
MYGEIPGVPLAVPMRQRKPSPETNSGEREEIVDALAAQDEPVEATGAQDAVLFQGLWAHGNPMIGVGQTPQKPTLSTRQKIALLLDSLLPISGPGSVVPYFYLTFVLYLILREWVVVLAVALVWAYLTAAIYIFMRAWDFPIGGIPAPVVAYDPLATQVILYNPLWSIAGLLTGVFTVEAFKLVALRDCSLCWELIVQAIILFIIAVKHGEYTAWCVHNVFVPLYALAGVAVWNTYGDDPRGYTSFETFAPYLVWVLFTWYIGAAWLLSNMLIGVRTTKIKGRVFVWSVQGTYGWTIYFAVTLYIFGVSIYRIILDSV